MIEKTNSKDHNSQPVIRVKSRTGKLLDLSSSGFKNRFGVEYTARLIVDQSCSSRASVDAVADARYQDQIRSTVIADVYIQKVSEAVGHGVFAYDEIEAGQMIGEYTGLARRKKNSDCSNAYIFNYTSDDVIDASKRGNSMRFINHSNQNANTNYKRVMVDGVQHIIFIALRRIAAGEQILFDYGENYWAFRHEPEEI